ncbi:MAG: chemotaxis protein CheW [Gemmatimonadota bacterium]|nr:chemotaxis protein CheW [Gemmatimonadota bacterium]
MKKRKILYSELAVAPRPTAPVEPPVPAAPPQVPAPVPAPPAHIARLITPLRGMRRITPMRGTPAVAAARTLRERVRARSGSADLLLFRVAGERFAIDLAAVEEAIDLPPVHHVPEMPPAMLGVITVRGMLTPVYSPQSALGLALTDGASALIFKRGRHRFALVIDDVEDVMTLDLATLRDAPGVDDSESVLLGVVRQRDALLAVVDAESLLATCQAVPLLETA